MEINKTKLIELLEDDYGTGYWKGEEENSEFITEGIFLMRANYDHLIDLIKKCVGESSDENTALPLHGVSNNEVAVCGNCERHKMLLKKPAYCKYCGCRLIT